MPGSADVQLAVHALGAGNALAVGEDVIGPTTGLDIFLGNNVAAEVDIFGCPGRSVFAQAVAFGGVGINCSAAIHLSDLVFAVVSVLVKTVIEQVAGRVVAVSIGGGAVHGRAGNAVAAVHIQLAGAGHACGHVLLQAVAPGIVNEAQPPAAFIGCGQTVQGIVGEALGARRIQLVSHAQHIAVILGAVVEHMVHQRVNRGIGYGLLLQLQPLVEAGAFSHAIAQSP